jgi:AcrR family transcriptional regulator
VSKTRESPAADWPQGIAVDAGDRSRGAQLAAVQRARVISAMLTVCAEHCASNVTVAHVVACAGVSRRTFYELFEDCEDCFLATFDEGIARASRHVLPMYRSRDPWRKRIRASLEALLAFFDSDPVTCRFLVVEAHCAGANVLERRSGVFTHLVGAIEQGRYDAKASAASSPLAAEGAVGAVLSVIHNRMVRATPGDLFELANPLMGMIVLPYLGPAASQEEFDRPVAPREPAPAPPRDPLAGLGIRLTYRTMRVLLAISEHPGGSNREIGLAAGVQDQGQISKLLGRLRSLELIENTGAGAASGGPNSWRLTAKGSEVRALASIQER